mmetsp:Transcript_59948/g.97036  ORF Transcript_59948/g.97036 Transcript_59948/m.97036 type:complete len:1938 (-) Transcript_59948:58-5871(-)
MDEEDLASSLDEEASAVDDGEESRQGTDSEQQEDGDDLQDDFDMDARVGHLSRAQIADLPAEEQLAKWNEMLLPTEADLVTELDATNLFFINVESIIFDLILSKEVPFEEDIQFLRFTYALEQLLTSIRSCGGVFRLIFFEGTKCLFNAAFGESVWAFRQAFLAHCQTSGIDHAVFQHWYSSEWKEHVATWRPSFFLVANNPIELEEDEEAEEEEDQKPKLKEVFHALMLRCLSYKVHVALLSGLQRRGNRIMAFTLEPDNYDSFIDHNCQAAFMPLLDEEEEEGEEGESPAAIVAALKEFAARAGDKVPAQALLRSFMISRFAKQTLALTKGQNEKTCQLMQLVVKVLVMQEMLLRYIPLDKRAYSTFAAEEWELFSESISGALDRYFTLISEELGKIRKLGVPEGFQLHACDLFDGRLYRHVFRFAVEKGLEADDNQVGADVFSFREYLSEELEFLWTEAAGTDKFWPLSMSALKDLPGIEPPDLPEKMAPRPKPELVDVKSSFLQTLWAEQGFEHADLLDPADEEEEGSDLLWERHTWNKGVYIDDVAKEQEMEKNEGEKRLEEKMKAKSGKLTERDLQFIAKFVLKKRQLALRKLHRYSKSLTGSDKLHPPIIMKETQDDKGGKKEEKVVEVKLSSKHQEIIDKRKQEEDLKTKEYDAKKLKDWEKPVEKLAEVNDPGEMEKELLDLLVGYNRVTASFVGFPAMNAAFKTSEAQSKVLLKVLKSLRTALKKMQLDKLPTESQQKARQLVCYVFIIVQEGFNSFGKKDLDGKGIKIFQETLISIGFPKTAVTMFETWKQAQKPADSKEDEKEADKGGKDDKKKGKDAKDDKKKDDKKDKKDDKKDKKDDKKDKKKDDDGDEKDLDSYKVSKEVDTFWSGVGPDEFAFQLMYMGPHMARSVGTAKDPLARVNFKPDGWQKDLLDIVDDKRSALVVAPTASGKTFIGYYVMDKVLRADNEGVAVYVAPSKALVNQVSAEIYARFSSKTYPAHSKNELLGVFLKEYNSAGGVMEAGKWKNCQVLVTVPHILEMLLLSPSNQDWVKRLRYVVFDEVHCIGEQEGGVQWEHSMQLIPCPFIALSATVADPSFFHNWLSRVNARKKTSKVEIVVHTERWNDLYKYIWHGDELRQLHPFVCLIEPNVRRNGISADLSLVPQEMISLWQQVKKVIGNNASWDKLAPTICFTDKSGFLTMTKRDARVYEKQLKVTFMELLKENVITTEGFSAMQLGLQGEIMLEWGGAQKFSPPPRAIVDKVATTEDSTEILADMTKLGKGSSYLQAATLYKLCRNLDKLEILPAIFFNFSRKEIERMLQKLVQELKDQQHNKYYGTEEASYKSKRIMEKREANFESAKVAYAQALKAKASASQESTAARKGGDEEGRGAGKSEAVDVSQESMMPEPIPPADLADEIDMEFSFHSPKVLGQWQEDIEETLQELKKNGTADWLIDGLRRGVGMHHEGCKRTYKDAVEILFRRGYLRVVFATGTLALGINMPCRSTIFCGDSLDLNGLMFRQMSGRAGRRGFDLLGQVVFLDMAFPKVQRLIASDLSNLAGEFTLSPTVLLRALHMWERMTLDFEEQDKVLPRSREDVSRCLSPMFSIPFFQSKTAELSTQVAYHTRFSVEILYKEGLINHEGGTRNLANMLTHLFEVEPANFALSRLLTSGSLHQYLTAEAKKQKKGDRRTHLTIKLLGVLAWLLYRRRLPSVLPKKEPRKKHLPSKDCPRLPALPKSLREEIKQYNASIFSTFQDFAWAVASTRKIGENDLTLPLSQRGFQVGWDSRGEPFEKTSKFAGFFIKHIVRYRARSPFAALSGSGDNFLSTADLAKYARNVMHLDLNAIPTVARPPYCERQEDADAELEATNSWIVDFMIHGKIKYLWEDNGINATLGWKLISEFVQQLKRATVVLKAYCPADDIVLKTFTELAAEMEKYLKSEGGR